MKIQPQRIPRSIRKQSQERIFTAAVIAICSANHFIDIGQSVHAACPPDLNGDNIVDGVDLASMLSNWGGPGGDITGDGLTDGTDLASVLSSWGPCPAPAPEWLIVTSTNTTTTTAYDSAGLVAKTWVGAAGGASVAYLRGDGTLVRPTIYSAGIYNGAARGGRIQVFNAAGAIVNDLIVSNAEYAQHHDIRLMPNGNILCIVWEGHTQAEGTAMGRVNLTSAIWSDSILEIQPTGYSTYNIVWRWNLWNHLVQDTNAAFPNYAVVSTKPELVNINAGSVDAQGTGGWTHMNSIDYNPTLDQIVVSSRTFSELWVIDHSTTTAEAATHTGGARGRGGDILYRWGNPAQYDRGTTTNQTFFVVHSATWIDTGLPGAGNIMAFCNGDRTGTANDYSTVMEIIPPRDSSGNYVIDPTLAFGPSAPTWTYGSPNQIYGGAVQCGAFRTLDNTTLITLTNSGRIFEVNTSGAVIWNRDSVATNIPRAPRYRQVNGLWVGP